MHGYKFALGQIMRNRDLREEGRVVLWTHLGLGDQISASRILKSYLDADTEVLWPVKKRNLKFMKAAFGNLKGLQLIEIPDSPKREGLIVRKLSRANDAAIVMAGHGTLGPLRWAYPELPLNSLFNLSVGIPATDLLAQDLRERLGECIQSETPQVPFAFVDHHPGTAREIPAEVLEGIERKGLTIVHNPLGTELAQIMSLLDAADELHLVASAPLCLALTVDARAKSRTHYDSLGDPIPNGYERWNSVKIHESRPKTYPRIGTHARDKFRSKVEELVEHRA
jgi:hypothetical protein